MVEDGRIYKMTTDTKKKIKLIELHYFIGEHREFEYFMRRWNYNPEEWYCITDMLHAFGRRYKKGYVHYGDSAYHLRGISEIYDYINIHLSQESK